MRSIRLNIVVAAISSFTLLYPQPANSTTMNLVRNGSFEELYAVFPNSFAPSHWTYASPAESLNSAATGQRAILLLNDSVQYQVSQSIPTIAGTSYELKFAARAPQWGTPEWRGYASGIEPLGPWVVRFSLNGSWIADFQNDSMVHWEYFTTTFVATSPSTLIGFYIQTGVRGWPLLDDVSVVAVPEPGAASLSSVALLLGMNYRKRLKQKRN